MPYLHSATAKQNLTTNTYTNAHNKITTAMKRYIKYKVYLSHTI